MRIKLLVVISLYIALVFSDSASAVSIRRTHRFLRPLAMGGAFTAVADSEETIAYNPAGLYQKNVEWSFDMSILGMAYNDNGNGMITGEIDFGDQSSLADLPGERIYFELPVTLSNSLFIPDCGWCGVYGGASADAWVEIAFPPQTIIPTIDLEFVGQMVVEYAMAFEVFGINVGFNLKGIQREGVVASVDLLSASSMIENDDWDGLVEEYAADQPGSKLVLDFGFLYRFNHPWNIRIGMSALDMLSMDLEGENTVTYGGIDWGSVGEVTQLNTLGIAFTINVNEFDLTGSMDYLDFTYSYIPSSSTARRIALGFEAGYSKRSDNTYLAAIQLGLREFKYPSIGLMLTLGAIKFGTIQWTENFGTADNELVDTRYMFLISLNF
ncbi:hypothetical protein KJ966_24315 [bacterium]|nr:hypothetical protein [bacterium]